MAITIVTRRDVRPEYEKEAFDLLTQLRARAVLQPGYLSGETLFSITQNGSHLIISRWRSLKDWKAWEDKPERREIVSKIQRLLAAPAVSEMYVDSPPWGTTEAVG